MVNLFKQAWHWKIPHWEGKTAQAKPSPSTEYILSSIMALFGGGLGAKFSLCCLIYFLKSIWWYNAVYISMCDWNAKGLRDFLFYILIVETINENLGFKANNI